MSIPSTLTVGVHTGRVERGRGASHRAKLARRLSRPRLCHGYIHAHACQCLLENIQLIVIDAKGPSQHHTHGQVSEGPVFGDMHHTCSSVTTSTAEQCYSAALIATMLECSIAWHPVMQYLLVQSQSLLVTLSVHDRHAAHQ